MKTKAISNWPIPITVTDVRSFVGFTNYYRWFIHKYAYTGRPLKLLTSGENASKITKWQIRMRNENRLLT